MASVPAINFAGHPNGVRLEASDLQIDAEGFLKAVQARSEIIDSNHSLALAMGESLTANRWIESIKELFEHDKPRILMYKRGADGWPDSNPNAEISWSQLIQQVPVGDFRKIPFGHSGDSRYQCDIDDFVVQITPKDKSLVEFAQLNRGSQQLSRGHEGYSVDDIKMELDIGLKEEARLEERLKCTASMKRSILAYVGKVRQRNQLCQDLLAGQAPVSNTNVQGALVRISRPVSPVNSILDDPRGDIPFRSPSSQEEDDSAMPPPPEQSQPDQSSEESSEESNDDTDSDIVIPRKGKQFPPSEEEKKYGEKFVADGRSAGLVWGELARKYTKDSALNAVSSISSLDTLSIEMCISSRGGDQVIEHTNCD